MPQRTDQLDATGFAGLDLTDPLTHLRSDIADYWRWARGTRPVHWQAAARQRRGFWVLSTHRHVMRVFSDPTRFSSQRGNVLLTLLAGHDSAAGSMLAVTDPPQHGELRKLLAPALTRQAVAQMEERLRGRTKRLLIERMGTGPFDFALDIALPTSMATICDLLGVPDGDHALLASLTRSALSSEGTHGSPLDSSAARSEILLYFLEHVSRRRRDPGVDLVGSLLQARLGGVLLSDEQVVANCYSLLLGGEETSRLALVGAMHTFADDGAVWSGFCSPSTKLHVAVEEIIRWHGPTLHFGRVALTDVEIDGRLIRAGDVVTLWTVSANRDEDAFVDPDRLQLDRRPNPHLSFGYGPHFCIGAQLAKLELAVVLDEIRTVVRQIEPAGVPRPVYSNVLRGLAELPISIT